MHGPRLGTVPHFHHVPKEGVHARVLGACLSCSKVIISHLLNVVMRDSSTSV